MCFRKAHRAAWKCLASSSLATPGIYYGPETGGRLECVKLKWRVGNTLCKSRCSFRRVLRGSTQYNFWTGSFQQVRSERWRNGRSAYYQSIQYGAQPAFQGLHDKILRDGFVVGIKDKNRSEKLQTDRELTLKKGCGPASTKQSCETSEENIWQRYDRAWHRRNGRPRPSNRLANVPGCKSAFFTKSAKT